MHQIEPNKHTASRLSSNADRTGKGYIPTLDGWRAVAILLVLFAHYSPFVPFLSGGLGQLGGPGVSIFFGISGILICTLLLRERETTGRVNLKGFYLRRCFRILPVAWLFLIVVTAVRLIVKDLPVTTHEILASALFLRNYIGSTGNTTAHYWSLAIEEHFYFILPAVIAFCSHRTARNFCIGIALAVCGWRWFNSVHPIGNQGLLFFRTDLRIDALFDGALVAILLQNKTIHEKVLKTGPYILWSLSFACLLLAKLIPSMTLSRSLAAFAIPWLLIATVKFPNTLVSRFLEAKWLRWIGRVSYSIYIWQGLFTSNEGYLLWGNRFVALNLLAMLGVSVASYYLLERPFVRWGHRLSRPVNPGRADLQ